LRSESLVRMAKQLSLARLQADQFLAALHEYRIGPIVSEREREVIWGVTGQGVCVGGMTADGFHHRASQILQKCGRIYRFGNSIVHETPSLTHGSVTTLAVEGRAEAHAAHVISNLFVTGTLGDKGDSQSLVASKLIFSLLADGSLAEKLPEIRHYSRRPTFDSDFMLCSSGWNPGPGILVHGPEIVPVCRDDEVTPTARTIDRLPPRLRELLREFEWRSDSDLVNAVGVFLTGLLINHFIDDPHPAVIVDGNQVGLGKTLLIQTIGKVLDDIEPARIPLIGDEEVEKRLCAQVRSSSSSLFFFDNVRAKIESMVLEQNVLSPAIHFRILGKSITIERPNNYLWMITSNSTAGTPDFISRAVPIRLFHEGNPRALKFEGDPLAYASRHRLEILGELAGMVLHWVEHGRPLGLQSHRCRRWAAVIGGILDVAGLGGHFLTNLAEAEAAMDQGLLDLATLAEHVLAKGVAELHVDAGADPTGKGRPAGGWSDAVTIAGVLREKLAEATNLKARETCIGAFLTNKVDRTVPIDTTDGRRHATLCKLAGRSRQKLY
jgi:hypothetical protein